MTTDFNSITYPYYDYTSYKLPKWQICSACEGDGTVGCCDCDCKHCVEKECESCKGTGKVKPIHQWWTTWNNGIINTNAIKY